MSTTTAARPAIHADLSLTRLHLLRACYLLMGVGLALVKWPLLPDVASLPLYEGVTLCLLTAMSLLAFLGCAMRSSCCPCCCSSQLGNSSGSHWLPFRKPPWVTSTRPPPRPWSVVPWLSSSLPLPRGLTCGGTTCAPLEIGGDDQPPQQHLRSYEIGLKTGTAVSCLGWITEWELIRYRRRTRPLPRPHAPRPSAGPVAARRLGRAAGGCRRHPAGALGGPARRVAVLSTVALATGRTFGSIPYRGQRRIMIQCQPQQWTRRSVGDESADAG
jgi:hypothetical protein